MTRTVPVSSVQPGWLVLVTQGATRGEWLEVYMVLETQRRGKPNRVWIYLTDRAQPWIVEQFTKDGDEVTVEVREV